jgi:hypothetical protein
MQPQAWPRNANALRQVLEAVQASYLDSNPVITGPTGDNCYFCALTYWLTSNSVHMFYLIINILSTYMHVCFQLVASTSV